MNLRRIENWLVSCPKTAGILLIVWFGFSAAQGIQNLPGHAENQQIEVYPKRFPDGLKQEPKHKESAPRIVNSDEEVIVAIIDTGVDIHHPILKPYIWINKGEVGIDDHGNDKSLNRVDDDGNGFIDDVNGFDFTKDSNAETDQNGHGTHIAGIIAERLRIAGVKNTKFMILTYFREGIDGHSALRNSIECVRYAIEMGAHVINYSGGGLFPNAAEKEVFHEAEKRGVLVVAAAGNEASDSEKSPFFPANYGFSNILSVTAVDGDDLSVLPTSNYGKRSVHLAASGKNIRSTLPGGGVGTMTGTSQATAVVTGLAVRAYFAARESVERPSPELIAGILLSSSIPERSLAGKTLEGTVVKDEDLIWTKARVNSVRNTHQKRSHQSQLVFDLLDTLGDEEGPGAVVKSKLAPL